MHKLHDRHTENVILAGLMREPDETAGGLLHMKFDRSCLYYSQSMRLYDVLMYCQSGVGGEKLLAAAFCECLKRGELLDCGGTRGLCDHLVDVWFTDPWFDSIQKWADMRYENQSLWTWAALAAAASVTHLAARRRAVYAAQELIRDAVDPVGGAEEIENRIDKLDEL